MTENTAIRIAVALEAIGAYLKAKQDQEEKVLAGRKRYADTMIRYYQQDTCGDNRL